MGAPSPAGASDLYTGGAVYSEAIVEAFQRFPEREAFVLGDRRMTFAEGAESMSRIQQVLAELGMGHLEDSLCAELSSGQAQKVWFAAATACHGAPLLLLDEPFSAVDVESVPVMVSRIERFVAAGGAAVLVTHSHTEHLGGLWRSVALDRSVQRTAPPR